MAKRDITTKEKPKVNKTLNKNILLYDSPFACAPDTEGSITLAMGAVPKKIIFPYIERAEYNPDS